MPRYVTKYSNNTITRVILGFKLSKVRAQKISWDKTIGAVLHENASLFFFIINDYKSIEHM